MDLNALCLLIFACLLNADGVFAANDCHPKGYGRNAIHACIEGFASGSKVAVDASKFNGSPCECKLSGKADANVTVKIMYITRNTSRIKFYVDDNEYNQTKTDHGYISNGETITIRVEMEGNLADNVRDGTPCLAFKNLYQVDQSEYLTITCFNGTERSSETVENTHDTNTNAGTVLESDIIGMEITSQGLEENIVTVCKMEEEPTSPRVSTRIIFCALGCASLAVVVAILLFICYLKRRRSNASPAIVKADVKGEEEYEVIENPMYNPMEARG